MSTYEANRYSFPTSAITSGTFDDARLAASNVTQHVNPINVNTGTWTPSYVNFACTTESARYIRVGRIVNVVLYFKCTNYTATDNLIKVQNLPYTAWNSGNPIGVGFVSGQDIGDMSYGCYVKANSTNIFFRGGRSGRAMDYADNQGTLRGHDAQWMAEGHLGVNQAYHMLTLTYISAN